MYEEHLTVKTNNINQFITDCKQIGVKPVVIELQVKSTVEQQVMTSWKTKDIWSEETLSVIKPLLQEKGYEVIREKIEVHLDFYDLKTIPFKYFEVHFKVKLTKAREEILDRLCKTLGVHKSTNILKTLDDHFYYKMITYRTYNQDLNEFKDNIRWIQTNLNHDGIQLHKVEMECCVKDSNTNIDKNWLG